MAKRKGYDHEKLGITFQELGALLGVRGMLESGSIKHVAIGNNSAYDAEKIISADAHEFNMRHIMHSKGCGTLGCIGGAMALIMGKSPADYVNHTTGGAGTYRHPSYCSSALVNLFYPDTGTEGLSDATDWDRVTPEVAVMAIDRFLAGKQVLWRSLVDQHGLTRQQAGRRARVAAERVCAWQEAHRTAAHR